MAQPIVHIIGRGVIGSLLAQRASAAQYPVRQYHHRRNKHLILPNIQIQQLDTTCITLPTTQCLPGQPAQLDGLVIIPIKAYQIYDVLLELQDKLAPTATIVLMHNGMGCIEVAQEVFPNNVIIAATTTMAGFRDNHTIVHTAKGQCQLGYVNQPQHKQQYEHPPLQLQDMINHILPDPTWHDDILPALYTKLVINCVINPLTAIHNIANGQLAEPEYKVLLEPIIAEVIAVATAQGVKLNKEQLLEQVQGVIASTANNYSSMQQDVAHGRRTEIEHINGYVVQLGQRHGIAVPENQALFDAICGLTTKCASPIS